MENRVYCLYRVSTDKQVDYNDRSQADIPMQRKACHRFAEEKGWTIIHEEQEDGVSGHKVRAENRDKLQIIKEHARQKKLPHHCGESNLVGQGHRKTVKHPMRLTQQDKYNGSGCLDMTAYLAMRNIERRGG